MPKSGVAFLSTDSKINIILHFNISYNAESKKLRCLIVPRLKVFTNSFSWHDTDDNKLMCDTFPFKTLISVRCHDHVFKLNFLIVSKVTTFCLWRIWVHALLSWGAFHLSELTGQTISVITRISLLVTIQSDQSDPKSHAWRKWCFNKTLGKKHFWLSKWLVQLWYSQPVLTFGRCP